MRILALDTSTEWCSVAAGGEGTWFVENEHVGQSHSERLLPMVAAVLAAAHWTPADLDGIAFGAGPGSFTGIRIGCGVAQGLALALDRRVVPIPTLEAKAFAADADHVFCCLDARMREVYVAAYAREATGLSTRMAPAVLPPDKVVLPSLSDGAWIGAGPGFAAYPELASRLQLAELRPDILPSAVAIATLALPRLAAGESVAAADALPLYVRHRVALTDAERAAGSRL